MEYFPESVLPDSMNINLRANNKSFTSSLNGSQRTANFMGDKWLASLSFNNLDNFEKPEIEILQSFIWSLRGINGRFKMWNFTKRGAPALGTPLVDGFTNTGGICNTKGWHPNRVVLKQGDFIELNNELKMITKDIVTSVSGDATIYFVPPIRNIPIDNEPIITNKPCGVFRLADDDQGDFSLTAGLEGTLTLELIEAIYVQ